MKRTTYIFIGLLVSGLIVIVATIIFIFMSGKPYQEDGAFLGNEHAWIGQKHSRVMNR